MACLLAGTSVEAGVLYVKHDALGANDGSSWSNAFLSLQPAIDTASVSDQVWIAQGTYRPTSWPNGGTTEREKHFSLKNGVSVYGGFAGVETSLVERDPTAYPTILSGDLDGNDADGDGRSDPTTTSNNAYHVFFHPSGSGLTNTALLDGVTIRGGNANAYSPKAEGAGIHNNSCSPTIQNCKITDNSAISGGGIFNSSSSPKVFNCDVVSNSASFHAGGVFSIDSSPYLANCRVIGNSARYGGGAGNGYSSPDFVDCTFAGNSASEHGGGIFNYSSFTSAIARCTFFGNSAKYQGGAICNDDSSPEIVNCTLVDNSASLGGGIYNTNASPQIANCTITRNSASVGGGIYNTNSSPNIANCILWANTPYPQIWDGASTSAVSSCIVYKGFFRGTNIIDADPLLCPLGDYGGLAQTMPVAAGSPAIDAGKGEISEDQRGFTRDSSPDIGACEFQNRPAGAGVATVEGVTAFAEGYRPTLLGRCEGSSLTYQWFVGASGDTATPILGATNDVVAINPLRSDTCLWLRVSFPGGSVDSHTLILTLGSPAVVFVSTSGADLNPGTNWPTAKRTYQAGLASAAYGAHVWMAEGTYRPNDADTNDLWRAQAFALKNGVSVLGGFAGTEVDEHQRNFAAHFVILSGDLDHNDADLDGDGRSDPTTTSNNALHVFCHPPRLALDASAVLDGVTIRGGKAEYTYPFNSGGGIYNQYCSPTIANCAIIDNRAYYGGGVFNEYSWPEIVNCNVASNAAANYGGAIYNSSSAPHLVNCTLVRNTASFGAGMFDYGQSTSKIVGCTFFGNAAQARGGAIFNFVSSPSLANCTIAFNSAPTASVVDNSYSSPMFINCTVVSNTGSSACVRNTNSSPYFANSILWANTPYPQISDGASTTTVSYCIVQNGYAGGTSIIDADPLLLPLGDHGGPTPTMPVSLGSPAIDAGVVSGAPTTDQRGFNRDKLPDIGSCEFQALTLVSDVSNPAAIGSQCNLRAISDISGATFQWFGRQSGDAWDPIAGGTDELFTTPPLDLGLDLFVRVTGGGTNMDSAVQSIEVRGTYPEWVAFHGLAGGEAETGANPARDGIPNLIKYASGLPPRVGCVREQYGSFSHQGISNQLSLVWRESKTPTDLVWSFRQSTNLLDWNTVPGPTNLVQSGSGYDLWEALVPAEGPRLFLDVSVDLIYP